MRPKQSDIVIFLVSFSKFYFYFSDCVEKCDRNLNLLRIDPFIRHFDLKNIPHVSNWIIYSIQKLHKSNYGKWYNFWLIIFRQSFSLKIKKYFMKIALKLKFFFSAFKFRVARFFNQKLLRWYCKNFRLNLTG